MGIHDSTVTRMSLPSPPRSLSVNIYYWGRGFFSTLSLSPTAVVRQAEDATVIPPTPPVYQRMRPTDLFYVLTSIRATLQMPRDGADYDR